MFNIGLYTIPLYERDNMKKRCDDMKTLVLTGSPHDKGCSSYLADHYIEGARQKGSDVKRFDTGPMAVHGCIGCGHCRRNENKCIFDDGMSIIYPHLLEAGRIVLITPVYYFGMTSQLKSVVDRFYSINQILREMPKELDLLAVCADDDIKTFSALTAHFTAIGSYLGWRCLEPLLIPGCATRGDIEKTDAGERTKAKSME